MPNALKTRSPRVTRQKQILSVDDLTGGLDLRRSQTLLGANKARKLANFSLDEPGALGVRAGYLAASSATFGGNPQGGQRVYLGSTQFTLMALDGAVYKPTDLWVKGAAVYSTISTANQVFFPHDRDLVAVMDGANRPRCSTDGSTWMLMGIDAPSSAAGLSSLSTGGLSSGEYAIVYTYKHRGTAHESNPSSESTITISGSSGAITATASPSTDTKVNAYVWYARHKLPDQEGVLRKVSSGSSATVVITSSNWTSNDEAPSNHTAPPVGLKFATVWKNRWWAPDGTVGNRLRFTEIFQNQTWPTTYYIDIPFERGDSITATHAHGDVLEVFGQSGAYLVIGQTSLDFEVRPSAGAQGGAFGQRAVASVEDATIHVNADDVHSFDGATDRSLAFDIQPAIRDLVGNSASATLAKIATVYDGLRKELRISVPRVYPTGTVGELVLNLDRTRENQGAPAWTTTAYDAGLYIAFTGNEPTAGNRGRIFFVNSTGGYVFEANSTTAALNSSNVTAEYEGPALSLGVHRGRFTDFHLEYEPHAGALSVEPVVDGVSQGAIALSIGTGLAVYGTAVYGTAQYGGSGRRKAYTTLPITADGRTVVTKLTYVGTERLKLFAYHYGVVPEPGPRQFSE
jgi:hypothetical protein